MDPYVLKPPTKTLSTSIVFFARQFFYPADPFRHNKYSMSNSNPLARLFMLYANNIASHMDKQAEAVECLYGIDITEEEFELIVNTIKECNKELHANFSILNELSQQYKLQYETIDGFILDKQIIQAVDSAIVYEPVNPYKPDPDVLKNILDES